MKTKKQYRQLLEARLNEQSSQLDEVSVGGAFRQSGIGGALRAFGTNVKNRGLLGAVSGSAAISAVKKKTETKKDFGKADINMGSEISIDAGKKLQQIKDLNTPNKNDRLIIGGEGKPIGRISGKENISKYTESLPEFQKAKKSLEVGRNLVDLGQSRIGAAARGRERLERIKRTITSGGSNHPFPQTQEIVGSRSSPNRSVPAVKAIERFGEIIGSEKKPLEGGRLKPISAARRRSPDIRGMGY